jgi:hypothetical protein
MCVTHLCVCAFAAELCVVDRKSKPCGCPTPKTGLGALNIIVFDCHWSWGSLPRILEREQKLLLAFQFLPTWKASARSLNILVERRSSLGRSNRYLVDRCADGSCNFLRH